MKVMHRRIIILFIQYVKILKFISCGKPFCQISYHSSTIIRSPHDRNNNVKGLKMCILVVYCIAETLKESGKKTLIFL